VILEFLKASLSSGAFFLLVLVGLLPFHECKGWLLPYMEGLRFALPLAEGPQLKEEEE